MLNLNYDARFDVLSVGLGDMRHSIGDEEYGGLVVMRDEISNIITGLTIFGFAKKFKDRSLPVWPSGVCIDVERDILPYVKI